MAFFPSMNHRGVWITTLMASAILMITMGTRQSLGLFISPLNSSTGLGIATISLAPARAAGLLLMPNEEAQLELTASWNWPTIAIPAVAGDYALSGLLERHNFILAIDEARGGIDHHGEAAQVPDWLIEAEDAWALVPLLHFDRLVGVIVLARPRNPRQLDWEDFDLLRVAGQQLASYLSEQAGQQGLGRDQRDRAAPLLDAVSGSGQQRRSRGARQDCPGVGAIVDQRVHRVVIRPHRHRSRNDGRSARRASRPTGAPRRPGWACAAGAAGPAPGRGGTLTPSQLQRRGVDMTKILMALLPLAMVTGFLTWVMIMGARDQARSDAWARDWASRRDGA